jgi:hypothetical protein
MSIKHIDISYDLIEGIYTVLENFVFREVDEITLTGTSGTATVLNNGLTRTATYATSLTQTATNFVSTNAAAYLVAGSVLTSSGAKLIFSASVPGVGFTGVTSITNATLTLAGTVAAADVVYPVYKSIPKTPASVYIYVGNVIYEEDGTKDHFMYNGTCQIQIVNETPLRADKRLTQQIINVTRGLLLPTKGTTFTCGSLSLVAFEAGPFNEVIEQGDNGITKIKLIDSYNFLIQ